MICLDCAPIGSLHFACVNKTLTRVRIVNVLRIWLSSISCVIFHEAIFCFPFETTWCWFYTLITTFLLKCRPSQLPCLFRFCFLFLFPWPRGKEWKGALDFPQPKGVGSPRVCLCKKNIKNRHLLSCFAGTRISGAIHKQKHNKKIQKIKNKINKINKINK